MLYWAHWRRKLSSVECGAYGDTRAQFILSSLCDYGPTGTEQTFLVWMVDICESALTIRNVSCFNPLLWNHPHMKSESARIWVRIRSSRIVEGSEKPIKKAIKVYREVYSHGSEMYSSRRGCESLLLTARSGIPAADVMIVPDYSIVINANS